MKLTTLNIPGYETVLRVDALPGDITGIIAVHSTARGPAAGGVRMRPYADFDAALADVLNLSHGMTLKNAAAGLPLGGGKSVLIGDPTTEKSPALMRAFGEAIESLKGSYWGGEDMGMTPEDMAEIARSTVYVGGLPSTGVGSASGDPSPITARGVFDAIKAACVHKWGDPSVSGKTVALQGLGHVGMNLAQRLTAAGAKLIVTDISNEAVAIAQHRFGAVAVGLDEIYGVEADIFAPCAIGGILNLQTIAQLKVGVVVGAANNQLATPECATLLQEHEILYAPDFVANAGGVINVASEILRVEDRTSWVPERLATLRATLHGILTEAKVSGESPDSVAQRLVQDRLPLAA